MTDRYRPRARSPPLQSPARSSLPVVGYYNSDRYAVPTRREIVPNPRSSGTAVNAPIVTETTYRIKPEAPARHSSLRNHSRTRRSTLDSQSRPMIVMAPEQPRHTNIHGGAGRPESPLHSPYRSSDERGEYYAMPASSGHRGHRRQAYSTTVDNADLNKLSREREMGGDHLLRVGSGREGPMYPGGSRSRQTYSGVMPRRRDSQPSDYDEDGYGYTNPKDLVQYDLNRMEQKFPTRRDSQDGTRPARNSTSGYQDMMPRSYDARERGPPPSMRGFDKIPNRAPAYDAAPPARMPPPGPTIVDPYYESEQPRRSDSRNGRRPVSVYHEQDRRRGARDYDSRDDDLRDRSEKIQRAPRFDGGGETRAFGSRPDRPDDITFEKKKDHDKRRDLDRKDDRNDNFEDYDNRDRKGSRASKLAAGLSLAGAAMGINAATKNSRDDDSDEGDEPRRRRDGDEHRRRREPREDRDRDIVDLSGRDPKERHTSRDDRDLTEDTREPKERVAQKEDKPEFLDLSGRNPQERRAPREDKDPAEDSPEPVRERRRLQKKPPVNESKSDSSEISPNDDVPNAHRTRRDGPPREKLGAFNPKDTMDLRALKDALNKQDTPAAAPAISVTEPIIKEPLREGSFERKKPRDETIVEPSAREERGRRDHSDSESDRRHGPRVVSPPRGELVKKPEEKVPVKGILRQPREKFPEDPAHIREGVAPLKGNKDIPPDKRWTKIDRRLVNPDALDAGKERYEAREDFVIVLRVLNKEEIQAYAIATQQIRAARAEIEEREEREERNRRRRERHERHKKERSSYHRDRDVDERDSYDHEHRRHRNTKDKAARDGKDSHSESDTTEDEGPAVTKPIDGGVRDKPRKAGFEGDVRDVNVMTTRALLESTLREDPEKPGTYSGYVRNPPRKERD